MIDRNEILYNSRSDIVSNRFLDLSDAINNINDPENLLASLLLASGFLYVSVLSKGKRVIFLAGNLLDDLQVKLLFYKNRKSISGKYKGRVEKVFDLVNAIEHELTSAMLLPPKLRIGRIKALCNRIGVDQSFFQIVLRNWS